MRSLNEPDFLSLVFLYFLTPAYSNVHIFTMIHSDFAIHSYFFIIIFVKEIWKCPRIFSLLFNCFSLFFYWPDKTTFSLKSFSSIFLFEIEMFSLFSSLLQKRTLWFSILFIHLIFYYNILYQPFELIADLIFFSICFTT